MPVKVRKVKGGWRVTDAGKVTARRTSRTQAERQARLLRAVAHGWKRRRK